MEGSRDDTDTPRGLIENMIGHGASEETVVAPRKRKFFRTPKEKRTIGGLTSERTGKRRHVSGSEALHTVKKPKQAELSESMFTPRSLIEHMTGDGNVAEQSIRVDARVTRSKSASSTSSSLNVSQNRTQRKSLRKSVVMKQVIRNNTDETTPRGLIEGFVSQGDESATLRLDPNPTLNKTTLVDVDLHKRRRMSSLGESFFVSSSAPEPRNLQKKNSSKRGIDPQQFAEKINDNIDHLSQHEAVEEAEINPTTDIPQEPLDNSMHYDKTEEVKSVLSSRRVSTVTPAVTQSVGSFHVDDTVSEAEASLEQTVDYTGKIRQSTSTAAEQTLRRNSNHNATTEETVAPETAVDAIVERLSRRKSRENIGTLETSHKTLPQNNVVDDGTYSQNDDGDGQDDDEASSENEETEEEEDAEEVESGAETEEQEIESQQEDVNNESYDVNTHNVTESVHSNAENIENNQVMAETKTTGLTGVVRTHQDSDIGDRTVRLKSTRRSSTRMSSSFTDRASTMEDATVNNTTHLRGYDAIQTPHIDTPVSRVPLSTPGTSCQTAQPVATVKPQTRRAPKNSKKDEATVRRIPRSITKSIFAHFTTLGFSKDTLAAVEKVSDKFWHNMVNDVSAYATHAHRATVEEVDMELLMKRQGFITDKRSLHTLIEEYLPLEYRQELIPIARAGNTVVPKSKK